MDYIPTLTGTEISKALGRAHNSSENSLHNRGPPTTQNTLCEGWVRSHNGGSVGKARKEDPGGMSGSRH